MPAIVVCAFCGRIFGRTHTPDGQATYGTCPTCLRTHLHTVARLAKSILLALDEIAYHCDTLTCDHRLGVRP